METAVAERRKHRRRSPEESEWRHMRLRTGDPLSVVDIGEGGVLVESHRRLLPGAPVVVLAAVEAAGPVRAVEARVVRCYVYALEPSGGVRYRGALEFARREEAVAHHQRRPQSWSER